VGDFNTPIDRPLRQKKKINKETSELNDTIHHIELIDIYRIIHPAAALYTFFSIAMELSSK
jgi:exonuclease III